MARKHVYLRETERLVREGERHIAELRARIARLEQSYRSGEAAEAKSLHCTFEETQRLHVEHLQWSALSKPVSDPGRRHFTG